jgi:lysozyme
MTRWWVALGLAVLLAACGGRGVVVPAGGVSAPMNAPRFNDAHPVDWPGHAPSGYPVHGIDVSKYQPPIDWFAAREAGVSFAFLKATEGGDRVDSGFEGHRLGAQNAGIPWGAYHFYYFCTPPEVQARSFIDTVPRVRGMLPPVLDMEWNPQSPSCGSVRPPPAEVRRQMRVFMDLLHRHYGQRPVIYTTPDFFEDNGLMALAGEEIWLRAVTRHPTDAYGVRGWTFWQYSATGLVPGIAGRVDLNAFGGSRADWARWLAARRL